MEKAVRADRRVVVALRVRRLAGHGVARPLVGVHTHDRGQQRRADDPAASGAMALVECGHDAIRAVHAGQQVRDRYADPDGLVGAGTGDRHQTPFALGDLVVARARTLRAVVPEPGDRQGHESGVELLESRGREPEAVEDARPEVLHQDIGMAEQAFEVTASGLALEVENERLLVAVAGQEVGRFGRRRRSDERRPPPA